MGIPAEKRIPGATYRLQFNRHFTFQQALQVVEYLRELGITDCYASPLFKAGPQSTHGYDICAFDQFNPHVGSREDFARFAQRLRELELGLLLDIVPNHMGNDLSNPWWRDVLEKGRASAYANWFDIDWQPLQSDLRNRVLLPTLEAHYAEVLEAGKLRLVYERGEFAVAYYDRKFPISPESYATILKELPLAQDAKAALEALVHSLNGTPGRPRSFDKLHALLQQQHYRLAFWRVGPEEINYRRFFDVTELVSLRMELPEVFRAAHQLVFQLISAGEVTGLRVDHPDGLWNPKEYFERLQAAAARPSSGAAKSGPHASLYIVAEKILTRDEPLPEDWPVDGTTGYDFLNHVNGLFVNPAHREAFNQLYDAFLGQPSPGLAATARASKRQILQASLISEIHGLAHRLKRLAAATRYGQDFTFHQIHAVLVELIAALPVYRTYITEQTVEVAAPEREYLLRALAAVRDANPQLDAALLEFVQRLLLLSPFPDMDETQRKRCRDFVLRWQQLSGPAMAKGLEDTAFYRFNRLVSLNEVGGDPDTFGITLDAFHRYNTSRATVWPHSLLATATHDTKRGEDTRARINVLSEMPHEWRQTVLHWREMNVDKKSVVDGQFAPRPNDEYLLYQILLGAWPVELQTLEQVRSQAEDGLAAFRTRIMEYMLKAIREAKTHTTWTEPDAAYEAATHRFVEQLLAVSAPNPFLEAFLPFQRKVAFFGQWNSLSQVLLKLTSPGVPDLYQGTELWDLSLVDPDNRRPVDYALRGRMLRELKQETSAAGIHLHGLLQTLLRDAHTGRIKLYLLWRALQFRGSQAALFERGSYVPLMAAGEKRDHVCAFARVLGNQAVVALAPRLVLGLTQAVERPPLGAEVWGETTLPLPKEVPGTRFRNVLTQQTISLNADRALPLREALAHFPVALLTPIP
jgi:(1->4)-alpha-D-glucan 1-alpha-D-glucosylmutase